jgi:hypothetical protein
MKSNYHSKQPAALAAICAILLSAFAGNQGHAQSFGINFLGNTSDPVTGLAGVLPIGNWNNISNTTFTSGSILSSDGLSSATLSLSGSGSANGWHSGTVSDGGNGSLLDGYMDTGTTSTGIAAISGLTGSLYNIFIYDEGDAARPGNGGDWLPNYTINGFTYYTATLTGAFSGFVQGGVTTVNNNTFPTSLVYGNYIEIDNVAPIAGAITVSANSDTQTWRSPFDGFQIVPTPEPSVAGLSLLGSILTLGMFRRRNK